MWQTDMCMPSMPACVISCWLKAAAAAAAAGMHAAPPLDDVLVAAAAAAVASACDCVTAHAVWRQVADDIMVLRL